MKKIIITGLLFLAGCYSGPYEYSGQYINPLDYQRTQTDYLSGSQRPFSVIYPQSNPDPHPNYWQEQNARREYFEAITPKPMGAEWIRMP